MRAKGGEWSEKDLSSVLLLGVAFYLKINGEPLKNAKHLNNTKNTEQTI